MKKLMLSVFALVAFGFSANAIDYTATQSAEGSAVLLTTISLGSDQSLNFGQITLGTTIGTLDLTADVDGLVGTEQIVGDGYTMLNGVVRTAAKFTVSGTPNASYSITLPTTSSSLTAAEGTEGVTISDFNTPLLTGNISAGGSSDFFVGGTLTIPSDCVGGFYAGSFSVTVAYD